MKTTLKLFFIFMLFLCTLTGCADKDSIPLSQQAQQLTEEALLIAAPDVKEFTVQYYQDFAPWYTIGFTYQTPNGTGIGAASLIEKGGNMTVTYLSQGIIDNSVEVFPAGHIDGSLNEQDFAISYGYVNSPDISQVLLYTSSNQVIVIKLDESCRLYFYPLVVPKDTVPIIKIEGRDKNNSVLFSQE